ncbi:MAG: signal peptide peptidase SppA, partial [Victivallales bacterium]|nr:signal peptide peptidase SppA [Victivallales bacterium]
MSESSNQEIDQDKEVNTNANGQDNTISQTVEEQTAFPPPPREGFFNERKEPEPAKRGFGGCFWVIILGLFATFLTVIITVGVVIAGAVSSFQSSLGEFSEASGAGSSFQESVVSGDSSSHNKIALINIKGIITNQETGGLGSASNASAPQINKRLKHILDDYSVKALIVRIESPGGEVTASDEIYHMLMKIKQERNIPVVASMGSLAASGGYYIACGCDKIVAHKMTTTGSIGVIIQTYKYYDMFQKIGLKGEAYTSGPMKAMLSGDRPTTEAEMDIVSDLVMIVYDDFVRIVAEGRPDLSVEDIKSSELGDGRVFLGSQAYENGLVDQLGYFDDAVKLAAEMAGLNNYKVVSLNTPFTLAHIFGQVEEKSSNLKIQFPGDGGFKLEKGRIYLLPPE